MVVRNNGSKPVLLTIMLGRDVLNGQIQALYPIEPGHKFELDAVGLHPVKKKSTIKKRRNK